MDIHTIIFSKDRPAQLDLLIRSIRRFNPEFAPTVLLKYNEQYSAAYGELGRKLNVQFYIESNFEQDLKEFILPTKCKYTQFLVDDQICVNDYWDYGRIIEEFLWDSDNICWSPRLGIDSWRFDNGINNRPELIECLIEKEVHSQTAIPYISWDWTTFDTYFPHCYYSTPMSLDGNIFSTDLVRQLVNGQNFNGPNQLEAALERKVRSNYYGLNIGALYFPCFVNSPNNRVQDEALNSYGEKHLMTPEEMNQKYLDGYQLKLEDFKVEAPHTELDFKWEK